MSTHKPDPARFLRPRTIPATEVGRRDVHWLRVGGYLLPVKTTGASREVTQGRQIIAYADVDGARVRVELHVNDDHFIDVDEFDQRGYLIEKTARTLADADNPGTAARGRVSWESLEDEDRQRWLRLAAAVAPAESKGWGDEPTATGPVVDPKPKK